MPSFPFLSRRDLLRFGSTIPFAGLALSQAPSSRNAGARVYDVRDYGAKGDGVTLDSAAVQAAIYTCTKDGGGTVLIPAGTFIIGTTELTSNVTLYLAAGAKLTGSADGKQYHAIDAIPLTGDSTLGDGNVGLLFAVKAENIAIEGPGTIDGQGAQFHSATRGAPTPAGISGAKRPYHVLLHQCKNVTIRDSYYLNSAFHSIRIIQSSYIKIEGIRIYSRVNSNNDGFHFISCQHVYVSNCDIQCQDDACALFGSCQYVSVTNCSFSTRWSVFRFGGGIAKDITVSNCLIYDTYGCPIKMRCGPRSRFENISFSNLEMRNVTGPISIGLGAPAPVAAQSGEDAANRAAGEPGVVRNISFNGIHATVVDPIPLPDAINSAYRPGEFKSCIVLNGAGPYLEDVSFQDVHVIYPGGGTAEQAAVRDVPNTAGEYFELGVLPAYALYARRVRGLTMQNVRFEFATPEHRPAVVFDHVEDAAINGMSAQGDPSEESLLRFIGAKGVLVTAPRVLTPTPVFLQVEGADAGNITIDGGDISKASQPVVLKTGASKAAVKVRG